MNHLLKEKKEKGNGGQMNPWTIFIIAAIVIILLIIIVSAARTEPVEPLPPQNGVEPNGGIESISVSSEEIRDGQGNVIIASGQLPANVDVSADSTFGASGEFKGAELSPNRQWIAITSVGVAHDYGWVYEQRTDILTPVAFQFGGEVDIAGWSQNSNYVAFEITSPAPFTGIKIVDVRDMAQYVQDTGFNVQVEGVSEDADYEFIEWDDNRLCFEVEGDEYCIDPQTQEVEERD